ncbi:uncharacterized protein LOC134542959 [Bacillus rossius redtenbacheri]|uniref:uncharacterized protein LOC134542959 n=1 Tax=Bacillus rossius redtenbacheri TaxID=93214 RepID=UPI002FDEB4DD
MASAGPALLWGALLALASATPRPGGTLQLAGVAVESATATSEGAATPPFDPSFRRRGTPGVSGLEHAVPTAETSTPEPTSRRGGFADAAAEDECVEEDTAAAAPSLDRAGDTWTTAYSPVTTDYPARRDPKVLNFFPIPVSEECVSNDNRRIGTCLNTYECRILEGESHGPCALGFGVCCVFTVSCDREVSNNVTYFLSPNFPELTRDVGTCSIQVKKMAPEISQLRLDFIHLNMGQPNRRTGVCDSDALVVSGGSGADLRLCGQNSGHHVYYDVENTNDSIVIAVNLTKPNVFRLWEIKVTQVEFNQRAPAGCLQYYQGASGVIQTLNFADNGRHLADQDYLICMRQEEKMCSIVYEPCDENSFKIGPDPPQTAYDGSGYGADDEAQRDCADRIVMPCDSEDFIMPKDSGGSSACDLLHCGSSFCSAGESPCRIESSTLPFNIRVQFGPGDKEESPDDNLGMCLRYEQQPCAP